MEDTKLGGILGWNYNYNVSILECYNTGNISGARTVGGIVGEQTTGIIENCYNTGTIEGNYASGGICGLTNNKVIRNCYNAGVLTGNNTVKSAIARISGKFEFRNYYTSNCGTKYANFDYGQGTIVEDDGVSVCVTEEELRNLASSLGENFTKDVDNINNGYPILKWQLNN